MHAEPRAGRLVAWGNAMLAGRISPDAAAQQVRRDDAAHRIVRQGSGDDAPSGPGSVTQEESLTVLLAGLSASGADVLLVALPVPGDPLGCPGPPRFNEAATAAGEAVVVRASPPRGLVPEVVTGLDGAPVVRWWEYPVQGLGELALPSLAEAERELAESLQMVTETLAAMDVARWRPEVAERIEAIRHDSGDTGLAPGYPARAHRVLASARRLTAIAALAEPQHTAAVSAAEMRAFADGVRPLGRAARRAQLAAFNAPAEDRGLRA